MRLSVRSALLAVSLWTGLSAFLRAGDLPVYTVYRLTAPVRVDGDLADPAWASIPAATGFHPLSMPGALADRQTTFRLAWDDEALYVAVDCYEPEIGQVVDTLKDDGELWSENGLECFLAPAPPAYEQVVLNTLGSRRWLGRENVKDLWTVRTRKMADAWTAEFRIPFASLKAAPDVSSAWRFNLSRNNLTKNAGDDTHTTWSPLVGSFHDLPNFGTLKFSRATLTIEQAGAETVVLRRAVLNPLAETRSRLQAECEAALAAVGKEFGEAATAELLARCRTVAEAARTNETSYRGLKDAIAQLSALARAIQERRLALLIESASCH